MLFYKILTEALLYTGFVLSLFEEISMAKLLLKHLLQVALAPSVGITVGWFGLIAQDVLPGLELPEWLAIATLVAVVLIAIAAKSQSYVFLLAQVIIGLAVVVGIPVYFFQVGFPTTHFGVMDYGGAIIACFVAAAFSAIWRLYRNGYTALDIHESTANLPKGSLSSLIDKDRN